MVRGNYNWHRLTAEEALRLLGSRESGLSGKEAAARLRRSGSNQLFDAPRKKNTLRGRLLSDAALLLFLLTLALAACFSELILAVPALIIFGTWISYLVWQSVRIERTQEKLFSCGIPTVTVLRNRKSLAVSAKNVVVGDVIFLQRGDVVPADCRLISSAELRVAFPWSADGEKTAKRTVSVKKADTVYPYQTECSAPEFENLVYAGSEIVGGSAVAVVFAVGRDTFCGMLGESLCSDGFAREFEQVGQLTSYFKLWSLLTLVLFVPIGIMGLLISPDDQSGMRAFLPVCAWAAASSAVLPYGYMQIAVHHRVRQMFQRKATGNGAQIKSSNAVDRLPKVTDLYLLGKGAISDRRLHFHSAFTGDGIFTVEEGQADGLKPLCEAFCLLEDAYARLPRCFSSVPDFIEPYLEELIVRSEFDRDALSVRVSKTEVFLGKREQILDVESADGPFRLRFSDTASILFGCGYFLHANGSLGVLDHQKREAYENFASRAKASGQRVVTVVKEQRGTVQLVGCLAQAERFLKELSGTVSQLESSGIRVHLFLENDSAENVTVASACMPHKAVCHKSQCEDLRLVPKHTRIFIGYSDQEIAERIRFLKRQRRVIGAVSCDVGYRISMTVASASIACDLYTSNEQSRCAPALQRDADALVAGVSSPGGGLLAVKETIFGLRETVSSLRRFFGQMFFLRMMQTAFVVLSLLFGLGYIPAYAVLYSSFFVDAFLLSQMLRASRKKRVRLPVQYLKQWKMWLCAVIPAVVLTIIAKIFYNMEIFTLPNCYGVIFLCLMLAETLLLTLGEQRVESNVRMLRDLLFLWIPTVALIALSILIPQFAAITELDFKNAISWIVLVFCGGFEAVLLLLLSRKDS